MQTQQLDPLSGRPQYRGMLECADAIVSTEGVRDQRRPDPCKNNRLTSVTLLSGPILTQFRGLWRGLLPPLLSVGGQNALLFLGYGTVKRYLLGRSAHPDAALSLGGIYAAGAASGLACSVVTVPTEVIKCRLQVDSQQRGTPGYQALRGPWDCIRAIVRSRGLPGLFQVLAVAR